MSLEGNSLLGQPKAKNHPNFPKCYPFPIIHDESEGNGDFNVIIGHLTNHFVEVFDEGDIESLYSMGFFGKGTLSRGTPQVLEKKLKESSEYVDENSSEFVDGNSSESFDGNEKIGSSSKSNETVMESSAKHLDSAESTELEEIPAKLSKEDDDDCVNISDDVGHVNGSDDDGYVDVPDDCTLKEYEYSPREYLQLTFEEAYFLSYGLGVLVVKDKLQPLNLRRLWNKFCEMDEHKNFPVMYTAYHHYRSKGWIVRSGTKYGTDFALYKDGPPFYHSTYAVVVKPVKEQEFRDMNDEGRPLTWSSLAGLNQMCNHAGKDVIILYVIQPTNMSEKEITTPHCVSQYLLEEVSVRRWVPSLDQCEK